MTVVAKLLPDPVAIAVLVLLFAVVVVSVFMIAWEIFRAIVEWWETL